MDGRLTRNDGHRAGLLGLACSLAIAAAVSAPVTTAGSSAVAASAARFDQAPAGPLATGLPAWTGRVDLYRPGVFTTQASWLWCTAANVQIARNIVLGQSDHSAAGQGRYFAYMRTKNHYLIPVSDGVDGAGWAAGLDRFVDPRYRVVTSTSFQNALRSAVIRLRQTNLPIAIVVERGLHSWLLTGFTATADPAVTRSFTVTSVRVVGPLYGLQSRNGYDLPPNTSLTPAQLATFFTPFHYRRFRMMWEGRWLSIQPIPASG